MRPDFLVIGCGKCGTTSLCAMLGAHPDVFVCEPKEPNFLSYDHVYARGWPWYESLFGNAGSARARGEGSVSYAVKQYEDRVLERLLEHMPGVRLIYITRDPLSRIESVYREHHTNGHKHGLYMPFTIERALDYYPAMLANTRYWDRIRAYRRGIPDDRILILFLEDLRIARDRVLARCFRFLGVDSSVAVDAAGSHLNPGSSKYYDTRLLRRLRTDPRLSAAWSRLPHRVQRPVEWMLRRRFAGSIAWSPEDRHRTLQELAPDARRLLRFCGKPETFWSLDA
ncbi:MAG: sulfotransferase [bacterium]|nr:sulfotransferase [bacterium]